jgi:signal transduction histidine kinase
MTRWLRRHDAPTGDTAPATGASTRRASATVWIFTAIGVLAVALALTATGAIVKSERLAKFSAISRTELRPAQLDAAKLAADYSVQEAGQQSFMLAGNRAALAPFISGSAAVQDLLPALTRLVSHDAQATASLAAVEKAASLWRNDVALPQIAARDLGAIPSSQLVNMALASIPYQADLRAKLDQLSARIATLVAHGQDNYDNAQHVANITTILSLCIALLAILVALALLLRMLTRPLQDLNDQIQQVAEGSYDQTIVADGAREIALIADSVERMRRNLVANASALVAANEQIVIRDERDRIALDLHDMTIQRVFGIGLMVRALGQRHPELLLDVDSVVEASDETIRELRSLIFGFRAESLSGSLTELIRQLVSEARRTLGFLPTMHLDPAADRLADEELTVELLAALREVLSNIARHAHASTADVELSARDGQVELTVTDDGVGVSDADPQGSGHANLRARAARLGGEAEVSRTGKRGTTVKWRVPIG